MIEKNKKIFLALTALELFWDPSKPLLFLGDWCKLYSRASFSEKIDGCILKDSQIDYDRVEAFNYTNSIYEDLLPKIAVFLNGAHEVQNSLRYWRILVGPFLLIYIQIVHERLSYLSAAYALHPDLVTIGLNEASYITPMNTREFITLSSDDAWNLQLFTQLLILMFKPPSACRSYRWEQEFAQREKSSSNLSSPSIFRKIKRTILHWYVSLRGDKIIDVCHYYHGLTKKNLYKIFLLSRGRILPLVAREIQAGCPENEVPLNIELRKNIESLPVLDDFSKIVLSTLKVNFPLIFIEYYKREYIKQKKAFPYTPGVMLSGAAWIYNDSLKFQGAAAAELGTKLVGVQHGGGYGALICHSYGLLERANTDVFISWGWEWSGAFPAPSTFICKRLLDRAEWLQGSKIGYILWASNEVARYTYGISSASFSSRVYLEWQSRFIDALNSNVFDKALLRLSPCSSNASYYAEMYPTLKVVVPIDGYSFFDQLYAAKIFVTDALGTTLNYALAFNIPTILFWDNQVNVLTEKAKPYFEKLQAVGIYHDTPESAAAMLNKISDDPKSWWESDQVQAARVSYCDVFARISQNWLKEWSSLLIAIAEKRST